MDDPALDPAAHRQALRGLRRLNTASGRAGMLFSALQQWAAGQSPPAGRPWRLLDVACGGGDMTRDLWQRARRARLPLVVHGCDLSPVALAEARRHAARHAALTDDPTGQDPEALHFFTCDALAGDLPAGYDIVICSLFLHHLDEPDIVTLLAGMAANARLVLCDDLVRSRSAWWITWAATRLLSRSPVVHTDGPRSIAGALTPDELLALAHRAGLREARVTGYRPIRMLLRWSRP